MKTPFYVLSIYEYDTYSYSGISLGEDLYFKTRPQAEKYAADRGYKIVSYDAEPNKEVTISEAYFYDETI